MDDPMDDPNHWLKRAEEARQIAKQLEDESMKSIMEDIAAGYERIADHVAHRPKSADRGSL
jgi:hypothetical protein